MPKISNKANQMPPSPIRKLVPFAEQAIARGVEVYHLNIGQPDIHTPEVVMEQLNILDMKTIEYSHSAGYLTLRTGLTRYYSDFGIALKPSEIMITCGGSEALLFAFQACFDHGDEVIIPEPFYANYNGFTTAADINVVPVTAKIEDGFALPPISEMKKLITPKTKGIVICNPSNPTGYLYSQDEIEKLKELILEYDLYLFVDEVYREFCYDGATPFSALQLTGANENVVVVDSVSKRYSMCGARIGMFITRNVELMESTMKFAQARLSPPTLGQIAAEAALKTPQSYFDQVSNEYVERRNFMVNKLNEMDGVFCPMPKGAFYAIAHLPIDDSEKFCRWMLEEFSFDNQTVMMAPATGFYSSPGLGKQEVRLAYVLNIKSLKKAMKCLDEALKVYPGRAVSAKNKALDKV